MFFFLGIRCISIESRIELLFSTSAILTGRKAHIKFLRSLFLIGTPFDRISHFFIEMRDTFYWSLRLGTYRKLRGVS